MDDHNDVAEAVASLVAGAGASIIAPFQRSGTLTAPVTGTFKFPVPHAGQITNIHMAVGTAPTGASLICDVNLNGTTIFTTQANRPTISAGNTATTTAPTPNVVTVAENDLLSVDVDQVGSSVAGSDLTVVILIARTN